MIERYQFISIEQTFAHCSLTFQLLFVGRCTKLTARIFANDQTILPKLNCFLVSFYCQKFCNTTESASKYLHFFVMNFMNLFSQKQFG